MKKAIIGALVLMLLAGAAVFAQSSDSDFVDVNDNPVEAYLGFQWNIDLQNRNFIDLDDGKKGNKQVTTNIPSINLGARQYFGSFDSGMELGYAFFINYGFISEMDFGGYKITKDDVDYLMNVGLLAAVSLRGDIGAGGLGFVADFGFAANADIGSWDVVWAWHPGQTVAGLTQPGSKKDVWNYQVMDFYFGVGLNAALQYRMPLADTSSLIFEAGLNFSLGFINSLSITGTEKEYDVDGKEIKSESMTIESTPDPSLRTRIGPYFTIGWKF